MVKSVIVCLSLWAGAAFALEPFPTVAAPRAVTAGPHEHFLASYFAINSYSPDGRYLLVLETDLNGRLPEANERCTLGFVDLKDNNRFMPITTTACWNFQEAAMAHWIDDDTILFNDVREGKFVTVVLNWKTKVERVLPLPVSAVSEDRTWAVSINYARLSLLRPDYGYAGPGQDARESVPWPTDDGLWTMDLRTGETKLILSVADTRDQMPAPKAVPGKPGQPLAYHCHTVISKDGAKIFFLARSVDWFDKATHKIPYWQTTAFTIDRDGKNLRRCFKDGWAASHFNWAPDGSHKMLVTATWNKTGDANLAGKFWSPVEFTVGEEEKVRRIGAGLLDFDWHCVYSPDGRFMSGETYWNKYFERPWVLVRLADGMAMPVGSFFVPEKYRGGYWRCDLHARWRPDGRQLAFNSVHEGSRQVYLMDVGAGRRDISLAGDGWQLDGDDVRVPHTWNAEDAADGIGRVEDWATAGYSSGATSYVRKVAVYRRALPDPVANKRYFVKCLGASMKAEVKVNGVALGTHVGAFTAFCFEATQALKPTGNELEITVDSRFDPDVQPINADFSVYGGLYRGVRWIETEQVCIDPVTDGASGVAVDADPKTGEVVAHVRVLGGTNEVQRFNFEHPKLWSPETPNLYTLNIEVRQKGCVDAVPVRFGFRTAEFRADGFYLNGRKRKIRGVCRHQDREGKGWAVSADDEAEDVKLIKSMGADGVRTSHYPQSPTFYDLCDEKGLLVWTEVPNVNKLTFSDAALENERLHVREMIAQHRNHPCVFAWGISNELYNRAMPGEQAEERMEQLRDYAKALDPSRTIVQAGNHLDKKRLNAVPEQLGLNLYPGWYALSSNRMDEKLDEAFRLNDRKIAAVTEYGGGGCIGQHADPLRFRPKPAGPVHPEEYQAYHHMENYRAISADGRIWGSFLWVMFDLGSDARREGQFMGRNDKGMVTWDRKNFKDAYYFYRANWTDTPTLRLVGTRMTGLSDAVATVIGFSNVGAVSLLVNGKLVGTKMPDEVCSVLWRDVPLQPGANQIELRAGKRVSKAVWMAPAAAKDSVLWRASFASGKSWQETNDYHGCVHLQFGRKDDAGKPALVVSGVATSVCETAWRIRSPRIPYRGKTGKYELSFRSSGSKALWKVVDGGPWISFVKWFDAKGRELARHRIPLQYPKKPARTVMTETVPSESAFFEVQLAQVAPIIATRDWIRISDMCLSEAPTDAACRSRVPDVRAPRVSLADPGPTTDAYRPIRLCFQDASGIDWPTVVVALDGAPAMSRFVRDGDALVLSRPASPWTNGLHRIEVTVSDRCGNAVQSTKFFMIGPAPEVPQTTLRTDGTLLVDGKPFFPIGIYGVGKQAFNGYDFDRAVSGLKAAGFNTLQSYRHARDPEFLAAVHRHGLKMWTDARKPDDAFLRNIRHNPDVIAWYLGDDTFDNTTPEQLHDRDDYMKAFDPSRLTCQADPVWSYSTIDRYSHYAAATDIFLPEIYPVRGKVEKDDRACVAFVIRDMRRIAADNRTFGSNRVHATWPIIQEFKGWSSWKRMPREDEFYGMSFAALVHGAKGITWYTYGGEVNPEKKIFNCGVTSSEDVWRATTNASRRIASLVPVLVAPDVPQPPVPQVLSGPRRDALDEGPSVTALEKRHDGWTYLLTVNAADAAVRARFAVGGVGSVEVLWEGRPVTPAASGTFEDDFAPLGVHVYRFRKQ